MEKESQDKKRSSNSKTDLIIKYMSSFSDLITIISIIVGLVGLYHFLSWQNFGSRNRTIIMRNCGYIMLISIPLSFPSVIKYLIDLLKKCLEWIKTNIITIIISISLVFVFLYFEKK